MVFSVVAILGSLVHKADFQRLLATSPRSRSAHFALHYVASGPAAPARPVTRPVSTELSTELAPVAPEPVDILPDGCWLGTIVPKRLARRAVTRNLLRRQIRAALARHASELPAGLWLVRLRAPFETGRFPSAASSALRTAAGGELDALFARLAGRSPGRVAQPAVGR